MDCCNLLQSDHFGRKYLGTIKPRPRMLCCPQSGQHSILGLGFNYDHLLISNCESYICTTLTAFIRMPGIAPKWDENLVQF